KDGAPATYKLMLALGAVDTAGDTFAAARDLGTLDSTVVSIKESLSNTDKWDFFKLAIRQTSQIKVQVNQMTANVDLYLYDVSEKVVRSSKRAGTQAEQIDTAQHSGTYYVAVKNETTQKPPYLVTIEVRPVAAYGHVSLAYDLGNGGSPAVFRSTLSDSAPDQYAEFSLAAPRVAKLRLDVKRGDPNTAAIVYLWSLESDKSWGPYRTRQGSPRTIADRLDKGSYLVKVFRDGKTADFELGLTTGSGPIDPEYPGKIKGQYDDWKVGEDTSGDKKECYAYSVAKSSSPDEWRWVRPAMYLSINTGEGGAFLSLDLA